MSNNTDGDLFGFGVGKIEHAVITDADAPAVAVLEFLATVRERIVFQGENRFRNARLHVRRQPGKFLPRVARDFNLPIHRLIFSSFNA